MRGNPLCKLFGPKIRPPRFVKFVGTLEVGVSPHERDGACFGGCRAAPSTAARGFVRIARAPGEEARDIFHRRGGRVDAGMESSAPLFCHVLR